MADLRASLGWTADDLGARLYDSLRNKLLTLPDETLVYSAHGAGSLCGKQLSSDTVSSLGENLVCLAWVELACDIAPSPTSRPTTWNTLTVLLLSPYQRCAKVRRVDGTRWGVSKIQLKQNNLS